MPKKNKAPKGSTVDPSLTDFVTALAQSATSDTAQALPCKAERIAKRQAKRQRKQQEHAAANEIRKQKLQEAKKAAAPPGNVRRSSSNQRQERLLTQWTRDWQALLDLQAQNPRYSPALQTSDRKPRNFPHSVQHKKMKTNLEPRKSDYGGLGLARATLYLPFADPSWQPRLEQAFAEHIAGWSGKPPMMQAMKKQRDSNLLWKRLQREKAVNKNSKSTRHLTPDERVEAMLKSGDLV